MASRGRPRTCCAPLWGSPRSRRKSRLRLSHVTLPVRCNGAHRLGMVGRPGARPRARPPGWPRPSGSAAVLWSQGSLNALICDGDCGPSAIATPDALTRDGAAGRRRAADAGTRAARSRRGRGGRRDRARRRRSRTARRLRGGRPGRRQRSWRRSAPARTSRRRRPRCSPALAALTEIDPQSRFPRGSCARATGSCWSAAATPTSPQAPRKKVYAVAADLATLATRTAAALTKHRHDDRAPRLRDLVVHRARARARRGSRRTSARTSSRPVSALWADRGVLNGTRAMDFPAKARRDVRRPPRGARHRGHRRAHRDQGAVDGRPGGERPERHRRADRRGHDRAERQRGRRGHAAPPRDRGRQVRRRSTAAPRPCARCSTRRHRRVRASCCTTAAGSRARTASRRRPWRRPSPSRWRTAGTDSLISDLAVGGFTGTLAGRFVKVDGGRGVVRGKSGTLTGVHSLAGYVTDAPAARSSSP